ncbi:uncharacterized protein LOC125337125 [Corvus hawaiiensis]|uniref:uncharacterized protein LOC125337125 n=1 Tax=Corvus hawaiiensis TaxID=134902 RepID=UPI00201965F4|nr:uncharacterized protein LOC125337125 [Corvus hawaiiensis]
MRELLTFEARALGSNYLLRYPLYVSPLPTQRHDARMDLAAWDRCKCLLRPRSTSGYATRSPSHGEPAEGAGFPGLELAPLRAQREQNLPPKRGRLGDEPHGSAAVVWPVSPSVRRRTGSNQPFASLGGLLPIPLLRRPARDCRRRGRKTDHGELNYLLEERDIPTPCRLLRLGVSRGGCSGLLCQTQGATERELPGGRARPGGWKTAPGGRSWKDNGDTRRHTEGHVRPSHPHSGDWDNSWSGLFIPVGNTSLYGLQDAVGSLGTKRASNVKAPFEEEIVLLRPHAWSLEGMAQWSDMKALSLRAETLLCIVRLARKSARGPWSSQASGIKHNNPLHTMRRKVCSKPHTLWCSILVSNWFELPRI